MAVLRGEAEITGSPFRVKTVPDGDGFQQCGFPGPIFAAEKGDRALRNKGFQNSEAQGGNRDIDPTGLPDPRLEHKAL